MNVLFGHLDFGPILYGVVMFLGLMVMWWKLKNGRWLSLAIDMALFAKPVGFSIVKRERPTGADPGREIIPRVAAAA